MNENRRVCFQCGEEKAVFLFRDTPGQKPNTVCASCRCRKGSYKHPIVSGVKVKERERVEKVDLIHNKPEEYIVEQIKHNKMNSIQENAIDKVRNGLHILKVALKDFTEVTVVEMMKQVKLTSNHIAVLNNENVLIRRRTSGKSPEYKWNDEYDITDALCEQIVTNNSASWRSQKEKSGRGNLKGVVPSFYKTLGVGSENKKDGIVFTDPEKIKIIKCAKKEGQTDILNKLIDSL